MTICGIIGDSIALGLALAHPGCDVNARIGLPASVIAARQLPGRYRWAAISAGSNNPTDPNLGRQLRTIRCRLHAARVIWILPRNARAAAQVRAVAASFGDRVRGFTAARDGVHPRSYAALARDVGEAVS